MDSSGVFGVVSWEAAKRRYTSSLGSPKQVHLDAIENHSSSDNMTTTWVERFVRRLGKYIDDKYAQNVRMHLQYCLCRRCRRDGPHYVCVVVSLTRATIGVQHVDQCVSD